MASVHNQVWNQYLSVLRTEKSLAPLAREIAPVRPDRQISDAQPSAPRPPAKGQYVDVVV